MVHREAFSRFVVCVALGRCSDKVLVRCSCFELTISYEMSVLLGKVSRRPPKGHMYCWDLACLHSVSTSKVKALGCWPVV